MFSGVRRHINATTIVAVFALVFAMTGGAFAVSSKGGSSDKAIVAKSKAKTKAVRGPAGPRGATGPAGAAGAQGAQGAQGPAGAQGPKGETGAAGTNGTAGVKGETGAQGTQGKEGKEGEPGQPGPEGTTGFTKTLPGGETETGTWSINTKEVTESEFGWFVPISFPIPLKLGLSLSDGHYLKVGETTKECPGSAEIPKAAEGQFCVYQGYTKQAEGSEISLENFSRPGGVLDKPEYGIGTAGTILFFHYEGTAEPVIVVGSWAVTATS